MKTTTKLTIENLKEEERLNNMEKFPQKEKENIKEETIKKMCLNNDNMNKHRIHFTICSKWDNGFANEYEWLGANSKSTMYRIARFLNNGNTYLKWEYNINYKDN